MGFKSVSLDDLVDFCVDNRGKTCPITDTENEYLPLIATNCITDRLYPVFSKIRSVDKETYLNWFRSHPQPGDIIFVNKGTPGKVAMVPDKVNFCIAQDMVALRIKPKFYNYYIYAVLNDPNVKMQIDNMQVGTLIPHLKKTDFKNLKLNIFEDYENQKKIGDFYMNLCKKIEVNYSIINKLEQLSQTLFKHWFINFEFPNEQGQPYKSSGGEMVESELGEIPKGWPVYKLDEFVESISTSIKKKEQPLARFLNTSDILNGEIMHKELDEVANMPGQAKKLIQKGDILYSEIRPKNKRHAYISFDSDEYVVSTKLMVLRVNETVYSGKVLYQWLASDTVINEFQQLAEDRSGTFPQITFSTIGHYKFAIPPIDIKDKLFNPLELMLDKRLNLINENKKLVELRDTLLPKLLSGEIEIPDELVVD
ncbi:restriction endonuclease subunit S [Bacillus sp. BP-3]|uniref:restriction endonuclease subunit S n=1 Tax=Bacillus sp. BP-3 TaxID=3022773 RepID=UPI0023311D59|nr:restriction endonuclease subunit S [Bacillus sp. BP-3]MDC2865319.1 restriction endonuclease subunit S [Bacillus sp. BP-3]